MRLIRKMDGFDSRPLAGVASGLNWKGSVYGRARRVRQYYFRTSFSMFRADSGTLRGFRSMKIRGRHVYVRTSAVLVFELASVLSHKTNAPAARVGNPPGAVLAALHPSMRVRVELPGWRSGLRRARLMHRTGSTRTGRLARAGLSCWKAKAVQVEARATSPCTRAVYRLKRHYRREEADANADDATKSCHMLAPRTEYVSIPA
jgi:hypothetical protein